MISITQRIRNREIELYYAVFNAREIHNLSVGELKPGETHQEKDLIEVVQRARESQRKGSQGISPFSAHARVEQQRAC